MAASTDFLAMPRPLPPAVGGDGSKLSLPLYPPAAPSSLDPAASSPSRIQRRDRLTRQFRNRLQDRTVWKEVACHISLITAGWSDATAGVLIPSMQEYFNIGYMVVSLLFVGQCVGFLAASVVTTYLSDRYGLAKVMFMGAVFQSIGYAIISASPPFVCFPLAYCVSGFGMALQDATANGYIVGLPNATQKLGWLHGFYGLGALISPLVGTVFVDAGIKFSHFYTVSLALVVISAFVIALAFQFEPDVEDPITTIPNSGIELNVVSGNGTDQFAAQQEVPITTTKQQGKMKQIMSNRVVWIVALFLMFYVGAEVTIGGWTVTYLQQERNGGTRAGYVASGFWAGITLGRVLLPKFNLLVGEKMVVFIYLALATVLELIVWLVPNFFSGAVAVSLVGFVLGPFYPNALSLITKLTPRHLHTGIAGFVASLGQTGSAIFPFLTGALAQKYSPTVLQPVLLGLFAILATLWLFVPRVERRRE